MNSPETRPARYEDLFDLPDNVVGEIVGGDLVTQPRPSPRHAMAASALGSLIFGKFDRKSSDGPGGWWILDEPECHLSSDVLVPDIAGWRQSTLLELPDTAWFDIAPDWVCEIVSPATQKYDRSSKRDIYAREHISHYWIVDPIAQLIEVFSLMSGKWVLQITVQGPDSAALVPFEQVTFDVDRLWV